MSDPEEITIDPQSILQTVKKNLNIAPTQDEFDTDIIIHINSSLAKLNQLGVGPDVPVTISGDSDTWDLVYTDPKYNFIQTYIYLSVRLVFDPPSTTTMYEAFQRKIDELEWRLYILADEEGDNE